MHPMIGLQDYIQRAQVVAVSGDRREGVYFATYRGFVGSEPALANDAGAMAA